MESKRNIIELIKILLAEGDRLPSDLEKIFEYAKKGIFPEKSELTSLVKLFPYLNIKTKIIGIKFLIEEYKDFIKRLEKESSNLLKDEIEDSRLRLFNKNINPLKLPQKKYGKEIEGIFNYLSIDNKLSQLINLLTEIMEIEPYPTEETTKSLDTEEIKEKDLRLPQIMVEFTKKLLQNQIKQEEFQENMNELFKSRSLTRSVRKELKEKFNEFFGSISDLAEILGDSKNDPNALADKILSFISDTDAHIILFLKFLNRLYHILKFKNRNYKKSYYSIGSIKPASEPLKRFLKELTISDILPKSAEFYLVFFKKFRKFRNLKAHQLPDNIKFSPNKKNLIIPQIGNREDLILNIEEASNFLNAYWGFINYINIHQN